MQKHIHYTFQIHGEKTKRHQDSIKTKLILLIFVWNGSYCPIWNRILKKQNALKWTFTHFPIIKNAIKRKPFKNVYEASITFFYLFYMPTFLPNLGLMRPLSYLLFTLKDLLSWEFIILIIRMFNLKKNRYVQTIRQKNCRCKLNVF